MNRYYRIKKHVIEFFFHLKFVLVCYSFEKMFLKNCSRTEQRIGQRTEKFPCWAFETKKKLFETRRNVFGNFCLTFIVGIRLMF